MTRDYFLLINQQAGEKSFTFVFDFFTISTALKNVYVCFVQICLIIGGCKGAPGGGAQIFMQFLGKIGQVIGCRPPGTCAPWEILDPPLMLNSAFRSTKGLKIHEY